MSSEDIRDHQFKKGKSGNPQGRPKGSKNITTQMLALLKRQAPEEVFELKGIRIFCRHIKRPTIADAGAARLVYEGVIKGNIQAIKEINDRTQGKARQEIELQGKDGGDLIPRRYTVRIVKNDDDSTKTDRDRDRE
jgi:hypothetical protein